MRRCLEEISAELRLTFQVARNPRYRFAWVGATVGTAIVLLVAGSVWFGPRSPVPFSTGALEVGAVEGILNPEFFGVDVHLVGNGSLALPVQVTDTPFDSFRFSPLGEATDQLHSVSYNASGVPSPVYEETDAAFVTGCEAIHCQATMMVPAEIDNVSEAVATVEYVERNLSFQPQYWAIGNEPQQWSHWGIAWPDWRPTDSSTPTAMQYAIEVEQYVSAIRAVDPGARFVGIESVVGGTIDAAWFRDLVEVDGPNISAVAYHAYPGGNGTASDNLTTFYQSAANPTSFPLNYPETVSIVREACPSRCNISVFVDEFNSALGGGAYRSFMTSYPEVPFVASAIANAIDENVTRVLFFDLEDLDGTMPYGLLTVGGPPRPAFLLFSEVLDHLVIGSILTTAIEGGPSGTSTALTNNATSTSLLVVNTNLTTGLDLELPHGVPQLSGPATPYSWDPSEPGPLMGSSVVDPLGVSWQVPPQGLLLLVWASV